MFRLNVPAPRAIAPAGRGTLAFYESQCEQYHRSTAFVDMEALYRPFLSALPRGASILDAGCGSGRDTKAFAQRGHRVTAIDASPASAQRATAFTGQRCHVLAFQDMAFRDDYDGIWACASLLHVPKREMHDVMHRFTQALKPGGVLYVSLKEGRGEHTAEDGRFFNYYTVTTFRKVMVTVPALRERSFYLTEGVRSCELRGAWLNVLLEKLG